MLHEPISMSFVLTSGGGGGGNVEPAFGPEMQLAVVVALVLGLVVLSYIYSVMEFEYAEE